MDFTEIKQYILDAAIVLPNQTTDEVLAKMEAGATDVSGVGYVVQFEFGFKPPKRIGSFQLQGVCGKREGIPIYLYVIAESSK